MDFDETVEELEDRKTPIGERRFEDFKNVVEILDLKQEFDSVHVTGTNGKGTVCNAVYESLLNQGYKAGLFTGPFFGDLPERIEVNNSLMSEKEFVDFYSRYKDLEVSYFELMVLIAFRYFEEKEVDIAIIEAGLGGRKDATNIVNSDIAVITNVGLDHKGKIGNTREEIAKEKAGIIKEEAKIVTAVEDESILNIIQVEANEKNASVVGTEDLIEDNSGFFEYEGVIFNPRMSSDYSIENFNTALSILKNLENYSFDTASITEAISELQLPGRMEKVSKNPEVFLDAAPNLHALKSLAEEDRKFETVVYGKNTEGQLNEIAKILPDLGENIMLTKPSTSKAVNPELFNEEKRFEVVKNREEAVKKAFEMKDPILFTGSMFFMQDVKEIIKEKEK